MKYFIFIALISVSCTSKIIEIPLAFEGERLVVNGVIQQNEVFKLNVTHTWPPVGKVPQNVDVNDALLLVFENNIFIDTLINIEKGDYLSKKKLKPKPGNFYRFDAKNNKYPEAKSAAIYLPKDVPFFEYKQESDYQFGNNQVVPQDKVDIIINETEKNITKYYAIGFEVEYEKNSRSDFFNIDRSEAQLENNCYFFQTIQLGKKSQNVDIYSNQCFSSNKPILRFTVQKAVFEIVNDINIKGSYKAGKKIILKVFQFQNDFIEYLKLKTPYEGFERAFKEPDKTYTNIKGGYGVIAAISESTVNLPVICKTCK